MKPIKKRIFWMIVIGIGIFLLLEILMKNQVVYPQRNRLYDFVMTILVTILIWEGNYRLDKILNVYFSWVLNPYKRILVQSMISLSYSFIVIWGSLYLFSKWVCLIPTERTGVLMKSSLIIGLLVTIVILSIEIGAQFFFKWKSSLVELEKYKTASTQAQLQNLKNQMNPHFLFNNLSVLSSLVYQNQDKAVDFINQLSKVYRYLLETKNHELIRLEEEMRFMESYFYLLNIRFGDNFRTEVSINQEAFGLLIPPLSVQTLVENAIKHNEVSIRRPLILTLNVKENYLEVCNNLQLREVYEPSSKIGLANIKSRYAYFTDKQVEICSNEASFCVRLPLLKVDESYNHRG